MFPKNFTRLLMNACAALLVVFGIYQFGQRKDPTTPLQPQSANVIPRTEPIQTPEAKAQDSEPTVEESAQSAAIPAFRQWAETAAASGFTQADVTNGKELAKARAISMKALIQADPASALRQALPANLRASLPPSIAAAIEQPVKTTGMCSMRMMCKHSSDSPHGNCESTPVLLEDAHDWNAYYGDQQWRSHVGLTVGFEGVAVDSELAVQKITPTLDKTKH